MSEEKPAVLWAAIIPVVAALVTVSGRSLYRLHDLARSRDEVIMSALWAKAVWCNVIAWIATGLPLAGIMAGWRICRILLACWSGLFIAMLALMIHAHVHASGIWPLGIVLLQASGILLLFAPAVSDWLRTRAGAA